MFTAAADRPLPSRSTRRPRGVLSRVIGVTCWLAALAALLPASAWMFSSLAWEIDLVANLGAQFLLVTTILLILVAAMRRRAPAAVLALACLLHLWPLLSGRAVWFPRSADGPSASPGHVRVLHYNDSSCSDKSEIYALMNQSGADVLHILCPPIPQQGEVIDGPGLEDKYPGKLVRHWSPVEHGQATLVGAAFVVAKWPIRREDFSALGPLAPHLIAGVVERPDAEGGAFAMVAVHPRSPRNASRWHEGNAVVDVTIAAANMFRARGLPVLIMTDLNSTPTGYRSRKLWSEAGMLRSKPALLMRGTFPDRVQMGLAKGSPQFMPGWWPASIAIDDVLVTPEIGVESWRVLPWLRGEHAPILVDLRVPGVRKGALEANPANR